MQAQDVDMNSVGNAGHRTTGVKKFVAWATRLMSKAVGITLEGMLIVRAGDVED